MATNRPPYSTSQPVQEIDIYDAVENGNLDRVRFFIEQQNVDVNSRSPGNTGSLLSIAARLGHLGIVEYLIKKGAKVNAKDKYGYNSLLWALDHNKASLELIKYLVEHGANVNATATNGYTSLHWAVEHNKLDVVQYLLKKKAVINAKTKDGNTPYMLAQAKNNTKMANFLLHEERAQNVGDIFEAAATGNLNSVSYLVEQQGVQPFEKNAFGESALHLAAAAGHVDIVKYLLDQNSGKVNLKNDNSETPLIIASSKGYLDMVKYLLEEKYANPESTDKDGYTPVLIASKHGQLKVIRFLVEEGNANVNVKEHNSNDVLHVAAQNGHLSVIKYFLDERKLNLYSKNKFGDTVLHTAALHGQLNIVKYLIDEKGMKINITNNEGRNILHKAVEGNHLALVKYLLDVKHADIMAQDFRSYTVFHIAAQNPESDVYLYFVREKGFLEFSTETPTSRLFPTTIKYESPQNVPPLNHSPVDPSPQMYLFDGRMVDVETRNRLVRDLLRTSNQLNMREESLASGNGLKTTKYFINGVQVDLDTRNKILNDYKDANSGPNTRFYVNGAEVDSDTRNAYLNNMMQSAGDSTQNQITSTVRQNGKRQTPTQRRQPAGEVVYNYPYSQADYYFGNPNQFWGRRKRSILPSRLPTNADQIENIKDDSKVVSFSMVDGLLSLMDLGLRRVNGNHYEQSIHESLLSPKQIIENKIDYNVIKGIRDFKYVKDR